MALEVRALAPEELEALQRGLPSWSSAQYPSRLDAQGRGEMVQVLAWDGPVPVGRGMVLFAGHEEYSESAVREGCAEVRDVYVAPDHRRRGVASGIMRALEDASRERGWRLIGLDVSLGEDDAPARALYDALGYRHAHGPFVSSASLDTDDGPMHV
ncbi:MAG TPA: GNAT family N-acetyltransferase, partial [Actinomycetota bacterium]|nr:GNAT family N-acetyltransferase [Actinomycetota bacterium]